MTVEDEGFVYVFEATESGRIKVGFSIDPKRRRGQIQQGLYEPLRRLCVLPAGRAFEKALHEVLAPHRVRGEWYTDKASVAKATSEWSASLKVEAA